MNLNYTHQGFCPHCKYEHVCADACELAFVANSRYVIETRDGYAPVTMSGNTLQEAADKMAKELMGTSRLDSVYSKEFAGLTLTAKLEAPPISQGALRRALQTGIERAKQDQREARVNEVLDLLKAEYRLRLQALEAKASRFTKGGYADEVQELNEWLTAESEKAQQLA